MGAYYLVQYTPDHRSHVMGGRLQGHIYHQTEPYIIHIDRSKNLPIPAMAYYINDLYIQRFGRGRGGPN